MQSAPPGPPTPLPTSPPEPPRRRSITPAPRTFRPPAAGDTLAPPSSLSAPPPPSPRSLRPPPLPDLGLGPTSRGVALEHRLTSGGIDLRTPATDLIMIRAWGHLDLEMADRALSLIEPRMSITARPFLLFNDWTDLESYDTQARIRLTLWVTDIRDRFEAIHILTRSRLVSMGVAVANLALDGFLIAYGPEQRARYDAALRDALHRRASRY